MLSSKLLKWRNHNLKSPQKLSVLDIACGPGNLTIELLHALRKNFPDTKIDICGLDYSEHNVKRLIEKSKGAVQGITGSFYQLPPAIENEDIIFSNEGLHWQPAYKMSDIKYIYLNIEERAQYEKQALQNFKISLQNIYGAMANEGIAVLQFGHDGQIKKLWDLIHEIFNESPFEAYRNKVNFPTYHPSVKNIYACLKEVGFAEENIDINAFNQDLTEDTPVSITSFFRGFTEPGMRQFFTPDTVETFYKRIEEKLNNIDINEFRKNISCRTVIKLRK